MHLYMIRHGQSYTNLPDWDKKNADQALTELGQQQAAALAEWLPLLLPKVDVIYGSTMLRARETAAPLAKAYEMAVCFDDRLREIGTNRLDHTPWAEVPTDYSDYWSTERPFLSITPNVEHSETWMHFRTRVGLLIQELVERHRDEIVIAVCHGGVVEATFDHIFNIGPWRRSEIWTHNSAITHFEYVEHPGRETWRLHFHNRVEHLASVEYKTRESGVT
ncbi:MAG: histidine phosphatase family protein [Ardenticatenaceae bacterium]